MKYFLYSVLLIGVIFILNKWLLLFLLEIKTIKNKIFTNQDSKLTLHVKRLITSLNETENQTWIRRKVTLFFILSASIVFFTFLIFKKNNFPGIIPLAAGILTGSIPYIFLRVKFFTRQVTGSYEGLNVITELLNQYKINHFNIIEALDNMDRSLDNTSISQRLLFKMSMRLKVQSSDRELHIIIDDFVYACGTQWGKMLGQNIYFAISEQADITLGLKDLLKECEYAQKMMEQMKRVNQEAIILVKFLTPFSYVFFIWTLVKFFQISFSEIISYQFFTPMGSLLFMILVVISCFNFAAVTLLSRPKFDI